MQHCSPGQWGAYVQRHKRGAKQRRMDRESNRLVQGAGSGVAPPHNTCSIPRRHALLHAPYPQPIWLSIHASLFNVLHWLLKVTITRKLISDCRTVPTYCGVFVYE